MKEYWVDFQGSIRVTAENLNESMEIASEKLEELGIEWIQIDNSEMIGE